MAFGDLVTLNVRGAIAGEEAINDEGVDYIPQMENTLPVPGFSVYLEGMTEGQEKDFTLTVPEENFQESLAGQECRFHVEVISVKEKRLPELDDEFAKGVRDGYESMEALNEYVRQRLTEEGEATAQRELERNALEEIKKVATIQASELIYRREVDSLREDHERNLRNNRLDLESYLRFTGQTEEEWEAQIRPQAEDRLATFLIMRKLAEQEELAVDPEEIDAEIERMMENSAEESADSLRRMLNAEDSRESIRSSLLNRKVLARLVEIATNKDAADAGEPESQEGAVAEEPSAADAGEPESQEGAVADEPSVADAGEPESQEDAVADEPSAADAGEPELQEDSVAGELSAGDAAEAEAGKRHRRIARRGRAVQ